MGLHMTERWLPYGETVVVGTTPVRVLASARHGIITASTLVMVPAVSNLEPG